MQFKKLEAEAQKESQWRQTYRMLCKKAPLEPEMTMEFATQPMIITSFRGARLYAPLPQDTRRWEEDKINHGQRMYRAYVNRDIEQTVMFENLHLAN